MKRIKRMAVILMCMAVLLSLFGCKDRFKVDGPDMENPLVWEQFSVSRSDAYAQHNFSITVERSEDGYLVSGTLRDSDGTEFTAEEGIPLPKEARRQLDVLQVQNLPDIKGSILDDDLLVLDAPTIQIQVVYTNGTTKEKVDQENFSLKVYQIVLPCFCGQQQ